MYYASLNSQYTTYHVETYTCSPLPSDGNDTKSKTQLLVMSIRWKPTCTVYVQTKPTHQCRVCVSQFKPVVDPGESPWWVIRDSLHNCIANTNNITFLFHKCTHFTCLLTISAQDCPKVFLNDCINYLLQARQWFGSVIVKTLNLRSQDRWFDYQSGHYQVFSS